MNAYYFHTQANGAHTISTTRSEQWLAAGGFVWLDYHHSEVALDEEHWQAAVQSLTGIPIDDYHVSDVLNLQHPSSFDLTDDYDFLIFRKLVLPEQLRQTAHQDTEQKNIFSPDKINTSPVSFILTDHAIVTIRTEHSPVFAQMHQRLNAFMQSHTEGMSKESIPKAKRVPTSPLDLCLKLLNALIDQYLDMRAPLTEQIQSWQTELLQGHHRFSQWAQLLNESVALQQLENLCEEQIDALQELRDNFIEDQVDDENANESVRPLIQPQGQRRDIMLVRIKDLLEHAERVQRHTVRLQASLQSAIDLHFSASSNQTNETMRFLAIVTAVFAPLTLLAGIYGMNFDIMPGLHNKNGFWLMLGVMVLTTVGLLYYFRRRSLVGRGQKSIAQLLSQQNDSDYLT
jgi:Mg2+ and Co2+ transporter CorA